MQALYAPRSGAAHRRAAHRRSVTRSVTWAAAMAWPSQAIRRGAAEHLGVLVKSAVEEVIEEGYLAVRDLARERVVESRGSYEVVSAEGRERRRSRAAAARSPRAPTTSGPGPAPGAAPYRHCDRIRFDGLAVASGANLRSADRSDDSRNTPPALTAPHARRRSAAASLRSCALLFPTAFTAALLPRHLLHAMLQKRLAQKLGAPRTWDESVSRPVPDRARQLAAELERRFAHDAELAHKLNDAHQRLHPPTPGSGPGCTRTGWPPSTASIPPR